MQYRILSEGVDVVESFEQAIAEMELDHKRLELKKYADCIHWHIRKPGLSGTLEATYLIGERKLWLEIRPARQAPWQDSVLERLEALFLSDLNEP